MTLQIQLESGSLDVSEGAAFAVIDPGPMPHVLAMFMHRSDAEQFCRRHPDGTELDILPCFQRTAVWSSDLPVDRAKLRTALAR